MMSTTYFLIILDKNKLYDSNMCACICKKGICGRFYTRINHNETRKEAGNLRFDIIQLEILSQKFVLYEVFESEEASAFHKTTSHYLTWRNTVENWMEQPRQGVKYRVIEPQNKELW